jgi:putative phosphoribosyl transferase
VIFAHGSGSSCFSRRNRAVAEFLEAEGFGTLLLDLLTREEEAVDVHTSEYRFDIERLGRRVVLATNWAHNRQDLQRLPLGYFGASTGAAAARTVARGSRTAARGHSESTRAAIREGDKPNPKGPHDRLLRNILPPTGTRRCNVRMSPGTTIATQASCFYTHNRRGRSH